MGNRNHAEHHSSFKYDDVENSSETWASGNTKTVINAAVRSNSFILIMWGGAHAGSYYVTCSNGSFTVTNSEALSGVPFKYRIL